jgi:signal transduction histidine kinase
LTGQVLSQFERQLRQRDIALRLRCEPDLAMDSYPGPFGQVLTNLAVNSMTHAFSGGGAGSIDVSVRAADHSHVELLFADDGCGMAPDVERRAFDPFFTTRRHDGASGLGLHIVHSIVVERLGGQLRLESKPGAGTTFQLILPRTAPDRRAADA